MSAGGIPPRTRGEHFINRVHGQLPPPHVLGRAGRRVPARSLPHKCLPLSLWTAAQTHAHTHLPMHRRWRAPWASSSLRPACGAASGASLHSPGSRPMVGGHGRTAPGSAARVRHLWAAGCAKCPAFSLAHVCLSCPPANQRTAIRLLPLCSRPALQAVPPACRSCLESCLPVCGLSWQRSSCGRC